MMTVMMMAEGGIGDDVADEEGRVLSDEYQ